jgi:hypothetical protein
MKPKVPPRLPGFPRSYEIVVVHPHDFYTNVFGTGAALLARVCAIASRREASWFRLHGWRGGRKDKEN